MELIHLWHIILRRKLVLILSSVLVLAATVIICLTVTPVYETVARIKIKRVEESQVVMSNAPPGFGSLDYIAPTAAVTQAEVVKSSAVVEPVIHELNLKERRTIIDTVVSFIPFLENKEKTYVRVDDFIDASIVWAFLQKRNLIVEPITDSDIIEIYAYSDILEEAKNIANEVMASYIRFNETLKAKEGSTGSQSIEKQLQRAQKELENASQALQNFQEKEASLNLDDQSKAVVDELQTLEKELFELRRDLKANEASRKALEEELKRQPEFKVTSKGTRANPLIDSVKEDLAELKSKLSGLSVDLTPDHVDVQSLKSQIKILESMLAEEPQQIFGSEESTLNRFKDELIKRYADKIIEYQELKVRDRALLDDIKAYKALLSSLATKKRRLNNLELAVEVAEKKYTRLSDDLNSAQLATSSEVANVTVITPAPIPNKDDPYYPDFALYLFIALFLGPFVGLGLAFLVDYVDDSLKSQDEIEEHLKLPILASFPRMNKRHISSMKSLGFRAPFTKPLLELRLNLREKFSARDEKQVMAIVSAGAGDGKSTIISGLACFVAQNGKRVILLDLNFYDPVLHRLFELPPSPGIGEVLLEQVTVEKAIYSTDDSNLAVIPCGEAAEEVVGSIDSPRLSALIKSLRGTYDVVLIDTPAIAWGPVAYILASYADGVIFVAVPTKTSKRVSKEARDRLERGGVKLLGVVLNRAAAK
ncbi:MAG: GumC family protein [Planctomycetota bacterium]|jgi:capsular exopolysaccharide synthesis family protein